MAKEKFRLDQVLNFRQEVEKVRQMEFIVARGELEEAEERLRLEEETARQVAQELQEKQQEGILAVEFQLYADYSLRKKKDIENTKVEVDHLDRKVAEKRETLISATKDKKVLEKFKDRKVMAQKLEQAGKERDFLDEIALQSSGREK